MTSLNRISPIDYGVFGLSLVIPVIIAIYYACVQGQRTTSQYMMADRKITALPMAFSLTVSYLSAVTITGRPLLNNNKCTVLCKALGF